MRDQYSSSTPRFFTGTILYLLLTLLVLTSCSSISPEDFRDHTPRFVPEEYFVGKSRGHGIFFDRFGKAQVSFVIDLEGSWDGKVITLTEHLVYDSGEKLERIYEITKIDDHHYEARTADIVGVAKLESYGNVLKWTYDLRQKIADSIWTLHFNDWMWLQSDGVVINRAYASKFGFDVGEVIMSVQKLQVPQ